MTDGAQEREVAAMVGFVNFMDEAWAVARAAADHAITLGTVFDEGLPAGLCLGRQLRQGYLNCLGGGGRREHQRDGGN